MFQTEKEQAEFLQAEYDLFAPTFKDNKVMLKALRKAILGIELTSAQKELLKLIPKEVIDRIESLLLPKVTGDEDLHMVNDFWFQFNLKERTQFQVDIDIRYLPIIIDFFESAVLRLRGDKGILSISDVEYSKTETTEKNIINVIARNIILATTEGMITNIYQKANNKPLTEEEIKLKTKANSSK